MVLHGSVIDVSSFDNSSLGFGLWPGGQTDAFGYGKYLTNVVAAMACLLPRLIDSVLVRGLLKYARSAPTLKMRSALLKNKHYGAAGTARTVTLTKTSHATISRIVQSTTLNERLTRNLFLATLRRTLFLAPRTAHIMKPERNFRTRGSNQNTPKSGVISKMSKAAGEIGQPNIELGLPPWEKRRVKFLAVGNESDSLNGPKHPIVSSCQVLEGSVDFKPAALLNCAEIKLQKQAMLVMIVELSSNSLYFQARSRTRRWEFSLVPTLFMRADQCSPEGLSSLIVDAGRPVRARPKIRPLNTSSRTLAY